MVEARTLWLLLPRPLRNLPADLAAVIAMVLVTNLAVFAPVLRDTPLRVPVGLAFILFIPGYAFIAALFPEAGDSPTATANGEADTDTSTPASTAPEADASRRSGIDGIERVALAFGLSIAITPLIGLGLNFTPWGIRLVPIMVAISLFTLGCVVVAASRRWALPADERFRVPYRDWLAAAHTEVFEPANRVDAGTDPRTDAGANTRADPRARATGRLRCRGWAARGATHCGRSVPPSAAELTA